MSANTHFPALIKIDYEQPENAPKQDDNADQFSPAFPRYFLNNHAKKGAKIFDPFLGFGTTAFIAEELGFTPFGVEADELRYQWAAGQLEHWQNIRCADAFDAPDLALPKMDMLITSPPFMKISQSWNPLYAGDPQYKGYEAYLLRLTEIFMRLKPILKRGAPLIIHCDNIEGKPFTPLKRDMSYAISKAGFKAITEMNIIWGKNAPQNYPQTYALIFKN